MGHPSGLNAWGSKYRYFYDKAANHHFCGDFDKAALYYRQALKTASRLNDKREEARCLSHSGLIAWDLGQIEEASSYLTKALLLAREANDGAIESLCSDSLKIIELYSLGRKSRAENEHRVSIEYYEKALAIGKETRLPSFRLKSLRQKGLTHWQLNEGDLFLECSQRGLEIARQINHRREQGRSLNNIGVFHYRLTDYYKALEYFEEAQKIAAVEEDLETLAEALNNSATVHLDLGNHARAERLYSRALDIDRGLGDLGTIATGLINLGNAHLRIGEKTGNEQNLDMALRYFSESLEFLEKSDLERTKIQVMNNVGLLHYLKKDIDLAKRFFSEAVSKARTSGYIEAESTLLINLGYLLYKDGDVVTAIGLLENAVRSGLEADCPETLWEVYYGLGLCYEEIAETETALDHYWGSIEAIEGVRKRIPHHFFKIGFTQSKIAPYQKIMDILFEAHSKTGSPTMLEDMFNVIERGKSQAFLEKIVEEEHRSENDRNDLHELMASGNPFICTIADVQNELLDKRSVLLNYFLGSHNSYVVVITKEHSGIYRLPEQARIERSVRAFKKILSAPADWPPEAEKAAARIGKELLYPLEEMESDAKDTIIIVPDGALNSLPFEALAISSDEPKEFLIKRHRIHYGPSASALQMLNKNHRVKDRKKGLLAIGGPIYDIEPAYVNKYAKNRIGDRYAHILRSGLAPLPFSKMEVMGISELFPAQARDVFVGHDASEGTIKRLALKDYQVIHFACHGLYDERSPTHSALVLSLNARGHEDGFLQMKEIYELKMNADLVVLSACLTGTGLYERAEGLMGLSRMFHYAGARSVLSSLWPIHDESTADFMKDFYQHAVQRVDTSEALRRAKLTMIESPFSHPFYWAGYILSGNPSEVSSGR